MIKGKESVQQTLWTCLLDTKKKRNKLVQAIWKKDIWINVTKAAAIHTKTANNFSLCKSCTNIFAKGMYTPPKKCTDLRFSECDTLTQAI